MQITVDIPDELYRQADLTAAQEGIPLRDLIAQGLRLALSKAHVASGQRVAFPLLHSERPGTLGVKEVLAAEEVAAEQEDAARAGAL